MIRINVVGSGFLDMEASAVTLKAENQQFRFSDIELGRTTEFKVPANRRNLDMLWHPEDVSGDGEAMRRTFDAEMHYDGGMVPGLLEVRTLDRGALGCVFYFGGSKALEEMMGRELSDCKTTFRGVAITQTPTKAILADPTVGVDIIMLDTGQYFDPVPSVNVKAFCEDVLDGLGATHDIQVDPQLWMVAASMRGGLPDNVSLRQNAADDISILQASGYLDVADIDIEWASTWIFGALVGGGTRAAKAFRCVVDLSIEFGSGIPAGVYLVKWQTELSQCGTLGGVDANGVGDSHNKTHRPSQPLDGMTVSFKEGDIFFFAGNKWEFIGAEVYYGYKDTEHPLSLSVTVTPSNLIGNDGSWPMASNMPDATVFEFLRSVALATGNELTVTSVGGVPHVSVKAAVYGNDIRALERVTSVEAVSRSVDCWGDGTGTARARLQEGDGNGKLGTGETVESFYAIANTQLTGEETAESMFTAGGPSEYGGIFVDVHKVSKEDTQRRWTLGIGGAGAAPDNQDNLGRIATPDFAGYADLANCSTCLKVRCHMEEASFLSMGFGTLFQWRGSLFVWTSGAWSHGEASLTLQKVSKPVISE